jgi:hypothetical protein
VEAAALLRQSASRLPSQQTAERST